MQSAENFLHDYLGSRTKVSREQWAIHELHVRRFFAPNYEPWDRDKCIAGLESEKIVSVNINGGSTEIVTTSVSFGVSQRTRYWLGNADNSWQITSMESACCVCLGSGKEGGHACNICKGKGWSLIGETKATNPLLPPTAAVPFRFRKSGEIGWSRASSGLGSPAA